jgi:hypothetical protein
MPNWRGSMPEPPIRRAMRSAWPPIRRAASSSGASWTDRIDEPAEPGRIAPGEQHEGAVQAHDRRIGQGHEPFGGDVRDQEGLESNESRGANKVGFLRLARGERQFARELNRVGADAVIGGDPAQSAQAPVERRCLAGKSRALHHRRSSLSCPGSATRRNAHASELRLIPIVASDDRSGSSQSSG